MGGFSVGVETATRGDRGLITSDIDALLKVKRIQNVERGGGGGLAQAGHEVAHLALNSLSVSGGGGQTLQNGLL